ncbi:coronin-2B isoform X5 [Octopus sinensis]|uniref:Coronin-2B isoform X5 n=1 Tax=Octopus sinensis TaxID=2607531 RepID=A0A7E6FFK2_9MOLL|nr:coronin-2B isoform X5 [Octopus sinensis]
MMAFRVRSSKYRHIFGSPYRKELCYENVHITRNAHDSNFCAVNPKFLAVVIEASGGGAFLVLPLEKTGRVDINAPKVTGHAGTVLDIKWNPFDDNVIASAADDNTVKVWRIPNTMHSNLTEWAVDLHGHQRKVTNIEWHPTASNIILSTGMDHKCILWNVEQAEPLNIINCHNDTVFSITWNREGSLFATTCKDRKIRVHDPRTAQVAIDGTGHQGVKASKSVFLGDTNRIFTTGFSRSSERQYAIWDVRNMTKSLKTEVVDFSSGILFPFYDHDSKVIFLAGKGDGNIRYYEIVSAAPYCHYLNQFQSSSPQRSLGIMPKRGCDAKRCEIVRFYKLHTAKDLVEPVSMIVPRKSDQFQDDIFPPTASCVPSLTADEWISGQNREPILVSLQDGQMTNCPPITSAKAVQKQDGALKQTPTITTFKAVNRPPLARSSTLPTAQVPPSVNTEINKEPASLKNIKRLSSNDEFVTLSSDPANNTCTIENHGEGDVSTAKESVNKTPEKVMRKSWAPSSNSSSADDVTSNGIVSSSPVDNSLPFDQNLIEGSSQEIADLLQSCHSENLTEIVDAESKIDTKNGLEPENIHSTTAVFKSNVNLTFSSETKSVESDERRIHVKKVWSPTPISPSSLENGTNQLDAELRKAYFQQVEEIKSLKEQMSMKDKRIRQLEEEICSIRQRVNSGESESNC